MTEQEFLEKRIPIWLEGEDLHISTPSKNDGNDFHAFLSKKYGYNWLFCIRHTPYGKFHHVLILCQT